MFQFRVDRAGTQTQPVLDLLEGLPEDHIKISIDDGCAWLSLYDLSQLDNPTVIELLEQVVGTIHSSDLAIGAGCLRCGKVDDAKAVYFQERPTRLCSSCLNSAANEKQERESELNRVSFGKTLGLPGAFLFAAAGWAGFWVLIDLIFDHFRIETIAINKITILLICLLLGGVGYALGWPTGATLRKSIAAGRLRQSMCLLFVLAVAAGGEILYVGIALFRLAGIFDLGIAAKLVGEVVASYTPFWIVCKLLLLGTLWFFCHQSASKQTTVRLDV